MKNFMLFMCTISMLTGVLGANVTVGPGDKYTVDQFGASKAPKTGVSSNLQEVFMKDSSASVKQSNRPLIK
jgi:hypothetical protein